MTTERESAQPYIPWRNRVARLIVAQFECGAPALRDIGIDPEGLIVSLLTQNHRCIHDPIKGENRLRCTEDDV